MGKTPVAKSKFLSPATFCKGKRKKGKDVYTLLQSSIHSPMSVISSHQMNWIETPPAYLFPKEREQSKIRKSAKRFHGSIGRLDINRETPSHHPDPQPDPSIRAHLSRPLRISRGIEECLRGLCWKIGWSVSRRTSDFNDDGFGRGGDACWASGRCGL